MDRASYDAHIRARLDEAKAIPFRAVQLGSWRPAIAECHRNLDTWVAANPGSRAVRGWVTYCQGVLTAHSVVAGPGGVLFDITPLADERHRTWMCFVEHLGSEQDFFDAKAESPFLHYRSGCSP